MSLCLSVSLSHISMHLLLYLCFFKTVGKFLTSNPVGVDTDSDPDPTFRENQNPYPT